MIELLQLLKNLEVTILESKVFIQAINNEEDSISYQDELDLDIN